MTNINVIENKISFIRKQLLILKGFRKYSLKIIENDPVLKGATERYLYLVSQATIDLAEAVISYKNYRKPTTYSESFDILFENKIINRNTTESLVKMAGFRNVIAHAYEKIDFSVIFDVLKNKLIDIEKFTKIISKKIILNLRLK